MTLMVLFAVVVVVVVVAMITKAVTVIILRYLSLTNRMSPWSAIAHCQAASELSLGKPSRRLWQAVPVSTRLYPTKALNGGCG